MLVIELAESGIEHYDYIHMPIDPVSNANNGYSFINFQNTKDVIAFVNKFQNRSWNQFKSDKVNSTLY